MNRLTSSRPDESLVSNRLLVEVEHLRLAEGLGLAIVIPFGNCQLRLPHRDQLNQRCLAETPYKGSVDFLIPWPVIFDLQ